MICMMFPKNRFNMYISMGLFWVTAFLSISFFLILASSVNQELLGRHETIQFRWGIWMDSIGMIKDKFFFGHGINTFMRVFQAYRENPLMDPTYAHNCYIQLAAETGTVGLFCFLWIIARVFHRLLGKIKIILMQDQNLGVLAIGLLSGIFAFLAHSFFDTNFYSLQLSVYLWFMVGLLMSINNISDTPKVQEDIVIGM